MSTTTVSTSALQAALGYAQKGWPVFPLAPRTKVPFKGSRGLLDGTTNDRIIRAWWDQNPDANVAIVTGRTSGLFVIDVDAGEGKDGFRTLAALQKQHGPLPETHTVQTPHNGRHLYLQLPPTQTISSGNDRLGRWLDVKGEGGYVVGVPSRLADGPYRTLNSREPARPPEWLLPLLSSPTLNRDTEGTEILNAVSVSRSLVLSVKQAVEAALPPGAHLNHQHLFKLARACLGMGGAEKAAAFDEWFQVVHGRGLLRPGCGRDEYLTEFWAAVSKATKPLGGTDPVEVAWEQAGKAPATPEAAAFSDPRIQRTVGTCYALHQQAGGRAWFLPCHTLARLAGVSATTAATWLSALIGMGVLRVVETHTTTKARRFQYVAHSAEYIKADDHDHEQ